jgi:peptidoglycan hydrolase CwlO-like protein
MMSDQLQVISTAILEIKNDIERIADKQEEMGNDIKEVKKAIYNPDSGLYARLRALEQWKEAQSKIQWGVIMTVFALVTSTIYKMIIES